ncbi:MAG TPA: hypothetical protein VGG39_34085 [Polyangiaceae bacterium]|jgi:hypothetical protein
MPPLAEPLAVVCALVLVACSSGGGTSGAADASTSDAPGDDAGKPVPEEAGPDPCIEAGTCPPGSWIDVTPAGVNPADLGDGGGFGPGSVVVDPVRPSDLYVAPIDGVWKSTDYGTTWSHVNTTLGYAPIGLPMAIAGTQPKATLWIDSGDGKGTLYKSTDGGETFTLVGGGQVAGLYSIVVDPYDPTHLLSGLHEADGIVESIDGGASWHTVGGTGWPTGGISWYPYFLDTGSASTTRGTWFAYAQDGATPVMTANGGGSWQGANGLDGLQHPHGAAGLYQTGPTLFVGGLYGPGQGVYRSVDLGASWARVDQGQFPEAVLWGTTKHVYAMWGWACSGCDLGTNFEIASAGGDQWSPATTPGLVIGPNSVAVTSDGTHAIFVGAMWSAGLWRYVEP